MQRKPTKQKKDVTRLAIVHVPDHLHYNHDHQFEAAEVSQDCLNTRCKGRHYDSAMTGPRDNATDLVNRRMLIHSILMLEVTTDVQEVALGPHVLHKHHGGRNCGQRRAIGHMDFAQHVDTDPQVDLRMVQRMWLGVRGFRHHRHISVVGRRTRRSLWMD